VFEKTSPESVGISSAAVLDYIRMLDETRMHTHGIIMLKGDKIIAEAHYKPFSENFLHRMYSVSKTFVAMAVGVAVTEGLIRMDDVISDYFPEFRSDTHDDLYEECTVRDMLSMRSNVGHSINWWGRFNSRVKAYYTLKSDKIPGTLYFYDSIGSFLLGCIIEKLTGKTFLEYLKEKVLLDIGFSKESYVLREPGGFSVGDSGVMCTIRDLMLFARFIMKRGEWNGRQYIDREFMENAIIKQSHNDPGGVFDSYNTRGYGYLTWITHEGGFTLTGMGDQLAICDMKHDFMLVMTADNQAEKATRHIIFHELCRHFLPKISDTPLPEDPAAYSALQEYTDSRTLIVQAGAASSPTAERINGVKYIMRENPLQISHFTLTTDGRTGTLELERRGVLHRLPFGIGENKLTKFSFGDRAVADHMGLNEPGEYDCAVSAAWSEEYLFTLQAQVIDTYFGGLVVNIAFKDSRASLHMNRSGQYVFEGIAGYAVGDAEHTF